MQLSVFFVTWWFKEKSKIKPQRHEATKVHKMKYSMVF